MSFSARVKDELLKKDFTGGRKAYNIKKWEYRQLRVREFLKKAFLECGSMTDPSKDYHLEFVCETQERAAEIAAALQLFEVEAKETQRGRYSLVYVKDSACIAEILRIIGAPEQLMAFENVRILKEMREQVNRRVNCETANINKTVSASLKQTQDILLIQAELGFDELDEGLREVAQARLDDPDATLAELAAKLPHPIGKSGINHRLRKLALLAEKLRESKSHGNKVQEEKP